MTWGNLRIGVVHVYCLSTKGRVTNMNEATRKVLILLTVVGKLYGTVLIKRVGD